MTLTKITDAVIPDIFYNPTKTGITLLDDLFSVYGGLIPSMTYMYTGGSGAGKTTVSNYIMSGMAREDAPAAFISLEMSKAQVKFQFAEKVDFTNTMIVDTDDLGEHPTVETFSAILNEIQAANARVLVIDSLQYASQIFFGSPTSVRGQSAIATMIIKFAKESLIPVIIIGQCGKDGRYIGPSFVKHAFDAHLHAEYDPNNGIRTMSFAKNRFGSVGEYVAYRFLKDGSLEFMKVEDVRQKRMAVDFGWHEAQTVVEAIYKEVIQHEVTLMVKNGVHIPRILFDGSNKVETSDETYHPKITTWMHFPAEPYFVYNTIYVDLENAREKFSEQHLDQLKEKYRDHLERFPEIHRPKQFFLLHILSLMAKAVRQKPDEDEQFWSTLHRLMANHG